MRYLLLVLVVSGCSPNRYYNEYQVKEIERIMKEQDAQIASLEAKQKQVSAQCATLAEGKGK